MLNPFFVPGNVVRSQAEITDTVTLSKLAAVVGLSKYMAGCLALRLLGSDPGALDRPVTESLFMRFYESELREADPVARVWAVLMPKDADRDYLEPDDFVPFVQELVLRHPGLKFLEATPEFQQRYVETVVVRMFYGAARGHHTRITRREFRHSDLVPAMLLVDSENDINKLLRYFSCVWLAVCVLCFVCVVCVCCGVCLCVCCVVCVVLCVLHVCVACVCCMCALCALCALCAYVFVLPPSAIFDFDITPAP